MDLLVCGRFELPHIDLGGFTHMISIQDSGPARGNFRPAHIPEEHYLYLEFSDVTDPRDEDAPNRQQLDRLIAWMDRQEAIDSLLVHCDAGMCRSPAVALFCVARFRSARFQDAMKYVHEKSSTFYIWPNALVVELADELVGANGSAIRAVEEWKQDHAEPL